MDKGKTNTKRERWLRRAEEAYHRMFDDSSDEELTTFTEREDMAVLISRELAAFLLEEHVASDDAVQPAEASSTSCPKCGRAGTPAVEEGEELPKRRVKTRVGDVYIERQRWRCAKCRVIFFSARHSAGAGDRRL